ncbi:MAG: PAS domain-containing sensor histidine kinase, partial [Saprospiraceae bacterium]
MDSNSQHFYKTGNFLSSVLETAIDAIIIINAKGTILLLNESAAKIFGYEKSELLLKNVNVLTPEPHNRLHDQYINNHIQTGINKIIGIGREVVGVKKDGTQFPVRLAVSKFIVEEEIYFTGVIHDLTAQKEVEQKLIYVNKNLENLVDSRTGQLRESINQLSSNNLALETEINERIEIEKKLKLREKELLNALEKERDLNLLKSRFVSIASHEFRTPLANILSSINLIEHYDSAETRAKKINHLAKIKNNIHYLNGILNEFLTLTRIEEGKFNIKLESIDLIHLVQEITEEFNLLKKPEQTIRMNYETSPEYQILTDQNCVRHIINNLIANAVKYSGDSSKIDINIRDTELHTEISVADDGIGIPESEQKFIFDIFYRGSNVLNIQGTGLG